ncbi:MAG: PQQ-dependent sugar dehydrogenase [Candidatus Diapherotrites archaeon]|nr:PQQ-dependent sugar dehydrogenase [Candidatus Diapherotrites archaeon]
MKSAHSLFFAFLVFSGCVFQPVFEPDEQENPNNPSGELALELETVAQNLEIPWSLGFLPDGKLIFTERGGKIKIVEQGTIHEVEGVAHLGESGLQGLAIDPGFSGNGFVYVYYTYSEGIGLFNRVSRFELKDNSMHGETILIEGIPGNVFHDGGRIKFGPDKKLYIATGDAGTEELSQDKNSLAGKMLRINADGSIPPDNPFGSAVFSMGHRNVQGFDWRPVTGELLATEHGPSKHDEVNAIEKGGNYGWPDKLCKTGTPSTGFVEAVVCFDGWTMAPSGAAFYSGDTLPLDNAFVYAGLRGEQLRALKFENGKIVSDEKVLDGIGRIRDVALGPDGFLYIATNNTDGRGTPRPEDDRIYRVVAK